MKKVRLLLMFGMMNVGLTAQSFAWVKGLGGVGTEKGNCIGVDNSGNVITGVYFTNKIDFDPGPATYSFTTQGGVDMGISKLDNQGNFVWARVIGSASTESIYDLVVDQTGNIYATGFFTGTVDFDPGVGVATMSPAPGADRNAFVLKLDKDGNYLWAKIIGDYLAEGSSLVLDAADNCYVTGVYSGNPDFDPGAGTQLLNPTSLVYQNVFILKLNSSGDFVWAKSIDNRSSDGPVKANGIAVDHANMIYLTGSLQGDADFDTGPGVLLLSSDNTGVLGNADIFLCRMDGAGNTLWAKNIGTDAANDEGLAVALDAVGNAYITGDFSQSVVFDQATSLTLTSAGILDVFVAKFDALGVCKWAKRMGGGNVEYGLSIALDAVGNVYTTGAYLGTGDFDPGPLSYQLTCAGASDVFISKLDANGDFVWAEGFGSTSSDRGNSIITDVNDNLYITGCYTGTVDFDPGTGVSTLTSLSNSAEDAFVLKLGDGTVGITGLSSNKNLTRIYPNPNNGSFTITSTVDLALSLTDNLGQILQIVDVKADKPYQACFKELVPGIYFLSGQTTGGVVKQKIIITD